MSSNAHSVAKIVALRDNLVPANHRDLLSAKTLYEKYWAPEISFVDNDYYGQKYLYEDVEIGFSYENFLQMKGFSYFRLDDGSIGKFTKLQFNPYSDIATASFWVRRPYTKNLREVKIEEE